VLRYNDLLDCGWVSKDISRFFPVTGRLVFVNNMEALLPDAANASIHQGLEFIYGLAPLVKPTVVLGMSW